MRTHALVCLWAVVALGLCPGAAMAQDRSTYYTVVHRDQFKINWAAFYEKAEAMTAATRNALPHVLDVAYGTHPKQRLDLYFPTQFPEASRAGAPVLLFLHGGGFREGDRLQYGFIAAPFAARGIITAVASYRLTPEFTYPAQPEDIQLALGWLWKNIKAQKGDPERIFVAGHSAGAILAADVAVKTAWLGRLSLPAGLLKGVIPISGGYDLNDLPSVHNYVPDETTRGEASPITHVSVGVPPAIVAVGSGEPYVASSRALVESIRARGGQADLLVLDGLDHAQTVLALGDERSPLFKAVLGLIETAAPKSTGALAR
jgi:arylformamidase